MGSIKPLAIFCVAVALLNLSAKGAVEVVLEAKPRAGIVTAQDAGERVKYAARLLQEVVEKSTGARLPLHPPQGEGALIHIGRTPYVESLQPDLDSLDADGFVLREVDERNFVIAGKTDGGTEYGVLEFLERYVGARWLMPGELWEDVPRRASLVIPRETVREEPVFLLRSLSPLNPYHQRPDDPYQRFPQWCRHNRVNGIEDRVGFHHNLKALLPPSVFTKTHPEFYPMVNPEEIPREFARQMESFRERLNPEGRFIPKSDKEWRWQPNFSAPGIVDAAAERIIAYFRENPGAGSYSLGVNDTHNYDQSAPSRARRSGGRNYLELEDVSDDFVAWANAVVEKVLQVYPDKWFGFLAYSQLAEPPRRHRLHPRLVPFITYERLRWQDAELRELNQRVNHDWENVSSQLGWWDYIYGSHYLVPRVYVRQMQEALAWGARHKVRYIHSEFYPNWGEGPKGWAYARMLWNPERDAGQLLEEWCTRAVGKEAAPALLAYYDQWEQFWTRDILESPWASNSYGWDKIKRQYHSYNDLGYLKAVREEQITRCDQLMNEVLRLAQTSPHRERAAELHRMWRFYRLSWLSYRGETLASAVNARDEAAVLAALEEAEKYLAATAERQVLFRSFKGDPLFHDVYQRQYVQEWPRRGANWGAGLISKAKGLSQTNPRIRAKLEELARSANPMVQKLATDAL